MARSSNGVVRHVAKALADAASAASTSSGVDAGYSAITSSVVGFMEANDIRPLLPLAHPLGSADSRTIFTSLSTRNFASKWIQLRSTVRILVDDASPSPTLVPITRGRSSTQVTATHCSVVTRTVFRHRSARRPGCTIGSLGCQEGEETEPVIAVFSTEVGIYRDLAAATSSLAQNNTEQWSKRVQGAFSRLGDE